MEPSVRFDRTVLAVESDGIVHLLVELQAPEAPASERPPLDVVLVIDKSGSMSGEPLDAVKSAVAHMLRIAGATDRIGVVAFDNSVELVLPLDTHDTDAAIARVQSVREGGMTNLSGGWLKGIEMLEASARPEALRRVVLLTDGQANVGETNTDRLAGMAGAARSRNITTTTIGFGDQFDEQLLSLIADTGAGNDYWCAGPDHAPQIFNDEFEGLASTVAQNVSIELRPADTIVDYGVLNEFPMTAVPGGVQVALGDAYGNERRRLVAKLVLPEVRAEGAFPLGEAIVRWATVGDDIELHTVTIPLAIGVSSDPDAIDEAADPEVIEHVNVLRAAEERKKAQERIDAGDWKGASLSLESAAMLLEGIGGDVASIRELRIDAQRLIRHDWDLASSKKLNATRRSDSQGRRKRYDH